MWNRKNTRLLTVCTLALLASAPSHALIISKSNINQVVVGSSDAEILSPWSVEFDAADFSAAGAANDIVQYLTVDKCGGENALSTPLPLVCPDSTDPSNVSNIGFSLTDPSGTLIDLVFPSTSGYGSYNNDDPNNDPSGRIQVTFDDEISPGVPYPVVGPSFISGTFAPGGFMSAAIGDAAKGSWYLTITNAGAVAPLGVARFTVNVTVDEAQNTTVPEPAAIALKGLGLAGVMAFRRRASA